MTIGQQLRQARQARSLSLEQAAQATHIRLHYLQALEEDQFERLPSQAQVRGFLRAYCAYLHLKAEPLLDLLDGKTPIQAGSPGASGKPSETPSEGIFPGEARPAETHETIFAEIGERLRLQREILGLSIEDVEKHTRIRAHYLRALESGDLNGLPSPVQGRGMLGNYAGFLGLEVDPLLLRFADGLQARLMAKQRAEARQRSPFQVKPARPMLLRRLFSGDLFISVGLVIVLIAFTVWATFHISELRSSQTPTTTAPSIADVLAPSATFTQTSEPKTDAASPTSDLSIQATPPATTTLSAPATPFGESTPTPTLAPPTPPIGASPLQIYVVAHQRAWMRIVSDGKVVFEGRVLPGSAYTFSANNRIELITGNAAGLQVFFNQQDIGPLGIFGQAVGRIFTLEGVLTPTPAISSTPTPSPTHTPAFTPTPGT